MIREPGDPGVVGLVGLVAQNDAVGGLGGHQMVAEAQVDHHGGLGQDAAPVKADTAKFPAGARRGNLQGHPPLGHGKQGLPLEKEGGEDGDLRQILHRLELLRGKAQVAADGGVAGTMADVVGAVVPAGPQERPVGAGQVIGPEPPEQPLTGQHSLASFEHGLTARAIWFIISNCPAYDKRLRDFGRCPGGAVSACFAPGLFAQKRGRGQPCALPPPAELVF